MAAQRVNALEMLREYNLKKTPKRKFRDIVADIENSVPLQEYRDLETRCNDAMQANAGLVQKCRSMQTQLTLLKGAVSIRRYWPRITACIALPALALTGWQYWEQGSDAEREARSAAFQKVAAATRYEKTDKDSIPAVLDIAGAPEWVIVRRDENRSGYSDRNGRPVTVQCVRLFAEKAVPEAQSYRKVRPYAFWGWGWLTWAEVAADCKPDTMRSLKK
jgi:hypothetical protein